MIKWMTRATKGNSRHEVYRVNDAYSADLLYCSENGTGSSDEEVAIAGKRSSCRVLVKEKIIKRRVLHRVRYFMRKSSGSVRNNTLFG